MWFLVLCAFIGLSNGQDLKGWSITRGACLSTFATFQSGVATEADCQQLCRDTTAYVCRAVGYNAGLQRCIFYNSSSDDVFVESPCALSGTDLLEPLALFSWFNTAQGCLVVDADDTYASDYISVCQEKCLEANTFQCNSFTYHNKTCLLSKQNSLTAAMVSPCDPVDTDYVYYERTRSPAWVMFADSSNNNPSGSIRTHTATSMFDCLVLCEEETATTCKGVMYDHTTTTCYLRSVTASETILSPSATRHFFERKDRQRWRKTDDGCAQSTEVQDTESGLTVEGCYAQCERTYETQSPFNCTSVNYIASTKTCELTTATSNDNPSSLAFPCQNAGTAFSEIMCTLTGSAFPSVHDVQKMN